MLAGSCKKSDNNPDSGTSSGTVKDIDGNVYHTVTIGTQVWMVENLKTTKYRDGSPIPNVTDDNAWGSLSNTITGAYCSYNNDAALGIKYGKLYNWYAVNDSRNIAPTGWHIPSDAEWETLKIYLAANLGTSGSVAKALAATTDWPSSNVSGAIGNDLTKNNPTGFTALPGGARGRFIGDFSIGRSGIWWSSSEYDNNHALYRLIAFDWGGLDKDYYEGGKNNGFSIRCVRDQVSENLIYLQCICQVELTKNVTIFNF